MSKPRKQNSRPGFPRWGSRAALLAACASIGAGGLVAGCGDDEESTSAQTTSSQSQEAAASGAVESGPVEIVEFLYEPEAVTVEAGTEITWTNADTAPHTATADDSSFDTGTLNKGDSGSATFDEPGTYSYFCRFHAFMKGDGRGPVGRGAVRRGGQRSRWTCEPPTIASEPSPKRTQALLPPS